MKRVAEFIRTIPHKRVGKVSLDYGITEGTRATLEQLFDPSSKLNINRVRIAMAPRNDKWIALQRLAFWIKKSGIDTEFFK